MPSWSSAVPGAQDGKVPKGQARYSADSPSFSFVGPNRSAIEPVEPSPSWRIAVRIAAWTIDDDLNPIDDRSSSNLRNSGCHWHPALTMRTSLRGRCQILLKDPRMSSGNSEQRKRRTFRVPPTLLPIP